jgi:hypothetical protein
MAASLDVHTMQEGATEFLTTEVIPMNIQKHLKMGKVTVPLLQTMSDTRSQSGRPATGMTPEHNI